MGLRQVAIRVMRKMGMMASASVSIVVEKWLE